MPQEASSTSLSLIIDSSGNSELLYSFSGRLSEASNNYLWTKELHWEHGHPLLLEHTLPQKQIVHLHGLTSTNSSASLSIKPPSQIISLCFINPKCVMLRKKT